MESTRRGRTRKRHTPVTSFLLLNVSEKHSKQRAAEASKRSAERTSAVRSAAAARHQPARARDSRAAPREVEAEASVRIWRLCLTGHARDCWDSILGERHGPLGDLQVGLESRALRGVHAHAGFRRGGPAVVQRARRRRDAAPPVRAARCGGILARGSLADRQRGRVGRVRRSPGSRSPAGTRFSPHHRDAGDASEVGRARAPAGGFGARASSGARVSPSRSRSCITSGARRTS